MFLKYIFVFLWKKMEEVDFDQFLWLQFSAEFVNTQKCMEFQNIKKINIHFDGELKYK